MKTVLSVDVAKNKSMIMLMNSDGEILIDTKEIKHNLEEFEKVKAEIKEINPQNLTIFMESTGTYHLPVERYFKENGFNTLVINSLTTKNNYDTIRKTKTDKKDCYRLAKLFFVNEVEYHELSKKDLYANLKAMTRQYFYLLQQNVSCKNRYKRLINICFPELEKIFKSTRIYDDTALNFIKEFPHAEIVKEKRIDALYNNLYKTNGRNLNFYKKLATTIKTASANSYPGVDKKHEDVQNLSYMAKIVQNNVSCKNRYKRLINICFPELEKIFKSTRIYEDTALNFIKEFPHAEIVKEKRIDALYNNLYKTNGRNLNFYKKLATTIKTASINSYPGVDKEHEDVKNLSYMAKIVQNNNNIINELREKMIETAKQSPYFKIINSFYGIGEILTAEILGELGDITRFDSPKEIIAFCGLDPTIKQSGKSINVKGAISKRGNKYARYILFNCSQMVVKLGASNYPEHPVYIYYQNKKAEGKHYYESLTACSTKILRMLYSMCKNNKQFLEN